MWPPTGKIVSGAWLDLRPIRVLYEADGPRVFVCRDAQAHNYLAYQCGESDRVMRFLVVPFSQQTETKLINGKSDVRQILLADRAWLFDIDFDWAIAQCWEIDASDLPEDCLPRPGIMLWSHLMPQAAGID